MKKGLAVVFAGQGAHRKGMASHLLAASSDPAAQRLQSKWNAAVAVLKERFGFDVNSVILHNPDRLEYGIGPSRRILSFAGGDDASGALSRTPFTQPAMLLTQWGLFQEAAEKRAELKAPQIFAGHSLGEFTALVAAGVVPLDVALDLVHRRGLCMEEAVDLDPHAPLQFQLFAASPERAELTDDEFLLLVELVSKALVNKSCFLEVANYNAERHQYVVAGNTGSLAVLGKCLDPLFRKNAAAQGATNFEKLVAVCVEDAERDAVGGFNTGANDPIKPVPVNGNPFVGGRKSLGIQHDHTIDGMTPPPWHLEGLAYIGKGRSGLKKKSWYIPVPGVRVPFHTSLLRRATDLFYPTVIDALPTAEAIGAKLESPQGPSLLCNLTGTRFNSSPGSEFRKEVAEYIASSNVGEQLHHGRYQSPLEPEYLRIAAEGSARELLAVVLAVQMSHAVQWHKLAKGMEEHYDCRTIVEVSPAPTLSDLIRKSSTATVAITLPRDAGRTLDAALDRSTTP